MTKRKKQPRNERLLTALVDLIGRSGAAHMEMRYSEPDDDDSPIVWIALARHGDRYSTACGLSPDEALGSLAERLLDGGMCTHCHHPVGVDFDPGGWRTDKITDAITGVVGMPSVCWYRYDPELGKFRRSCEGKT